jgi:arylsulfatase A
LDDGYVDQAIEKLGDHDPNGPFRGGKYNVFEGGTRTPFIARWIGNISPQVSDKIICTVDLPATFAHLVDAKLPENGFLDSYDLHEALLGQADATGRPHLIQQDNGQAGNFGYRVGKWKLIRQQSRQATNVELRLTPTKLPLHQLYDLDTDPGETRNVFNDHPDLGQKMLKELQEHIDAGRTRAAAEKKDN